MLLPILSVVMSTMAALPPVPHLDLPPCLAATLAPLLGTALVQPEVPSQAEMVAASATKVGDLGDYLKCIRLVNGTERIASYALVQFSVAIVANQAPASLNYGVCLPATCEAASVESSFRDDLPVAIQQNEGVVEYYTLELSLLTQVVAQIDLDNTTFAALTELLRNGSAVANATGFPELASTLSFAASIVASAGRAHDGLRDAEDYLDALNTTNATALAEELEAVDQTITHGLPGHPWSQMLGQLQGKLKEALQAANATGQLLSSLNAMARDSDFSVTIGRQTSPVGPAGIVLIVLFGVLTALTAWATVDQVRAERHASSASVHPRSLSPSLPPAASAAPLPPAATPPALSAPLLVAPPEVRVVCATHGEAAAPPSAAGHLSVPRKPAAFKPPPSLLSAFSLVRNWRSLGARRADGTMGCLDGLRCLSMAWVIFGHTIVYSGAGGGMQFYAELLPKGFSPPPGADDVAVPPNGGLLSTMAYQLVPAAFFAVDTFFWMGGLLTSVALIKQMRKLSTARWWKVYPAYAVGRWVRLTPLVIVAILWMVGINPALGDGPFWATQKDQAMCERTWWWDVLCTRSPTLQGAQHTAPTPRTNPQHHHPTHMLSWLAHATLSRFPPSRLLALPPSRPPPGSPPRPPLDPPRPPSPPQSHLLTLSPIECTAMLRLCTDIQNIMSLARPQDPQCLGHFWYLANDMQFFLLTPLVVCPYVMRAALGWALLLAVLMASTIANVVIAVQHDYAASPLLDPGYFSHIYVQPWTRVQPYAVGIGLAFVWDGWCLATSRALAAPRRTTTTASSRATDEVHPATPELSTPPEGPGPVGEVPKPASDTGGGIGPLRHRMDPMLVWAICAVSAAIMLADMFGTYGLYQHYPTEWTTGQNTSYIALSRLGWAIGLSGLAFLCFAEETPTLNAFLSFGPFEVLGKLCFAAYVVHPLIITPIVFGSSDMIKFSNAWFAASFTTYLVWAMGVALVLWLLVEKPSANLLASALAKLGLGGGGGA